MTATDDAPDRRRQPRRRRALRVAALAATAALLALLGAVAWLTATEDGLRRLAGLAEGVVAVEGPRGSLWRRIEVDRLAYRDDDGLSVEVHDAALSWSPWHLVVGVLQLRTVEAARVAVTLPASTADPAGDAGFRLPRAPVAIRVDRIELPRIDLALAPDVPPHRLRLSGHARVADDGGSVVLAVESAEPGGDRLTLDAAHMRTGAGRLQIAADVSLTAGGPVWALLGVAPADARPLRLALHGDGPPRAWQGRLEAALEDGGRIDATMATEESGTFRLDGAAQVAAGPPFGVPAALAGTATFHIAARSQGGDRIELSRLSLRKPEFATLEASGWVDLASDALSLDLSLALDPAAAGLAHEDVAWTEASLSGRIEGMAASPSAQGTARIVGLAAPPLEGGTARIEWRADAADRSAAAIVRMEDARWRDPALAGLLGASPVLDLAASEASDGTVRLDRLALQGEGASAAAEGILASDGMVRGQLELTIPDMAVLGAAVGTDLAGAAMLRVAALERAPDGAVAGRVSLTTEGSRIGPPALAAVFGDSPRLDAALRMTPEGALTVEEAVLAAAAVEAEGRMSLAAGDARLDGAWTGRVLPAASAALDGVALSRPLDFTLEVAGDPAAPTGMLQLSGGAATVGGTDFERLAGTARLAWRAGEPLLSVALEARVNGVPATARFEALSQPKRLAVSGIRVEAAGLRVDGALTLPDGALPAAGRLTVATADMAPLAALLGAEDASGALRGTLTLDAAGARQRLRVDLRGDRLILDAKDRAARLSLQRAAVTGSVGDLLAAKEIALDATVAGLRRGDTVALEGKASLRGSLDALRLATDIEGRAVAPFALSASAAMTGPDGRRRVALERLSGRYDGRAVALDGPTYLVLGGAGVAEAAAALRLADGRATAQFARRSGRPSLTAALDRVPVGPLAAMTGRSVDGLLSGSLDLTETARGVGGRGTFALQGIGAAALEGVPPVEVTATLAVEPASLDLTLTVAGAGLREAALRGRLPVRLSLSPPGGSLVGNGRVDLRMAVSGEVGTLWPYFGPPDQRLSGAVALDAHLTGTPDAPRVEGRLGLDAGRYEHLLYGTLLTGVTARAGFADRRLTLSTFRAADGGSGTLTAGGDLTFGTGGQARFAFRAEGRGMHLLRRDDLRAVGDLDLDLQGDAKGARVAGRVTVGTAEIDLAAALPPAIPSLDVQRVGDPEPDAAADRAAAYPVALDVAVAIPGQMFVRGRGLDSEWRGTLALTGTAAAPRLAGEMQAVRGQFDAIGRSFALRDSTIQFDGGAKIDPILGIRGEHRAREVTVVARLVGRASDPALELASTPPMPRDEILSHVLFGKSRGRLTAVEGAQLAAALSELSGGGAGLDVLGTLRRMAGVDVLQVDAGDGDPSVRAGKYVTDRVYVGARQGAAAGSGGVEVEVELTPNISVNSGSGQGGRSDVELLFKWDY